MEKILKEILDKLDVVMQYTFINEDTNLMDVYNELKEKEKTPPIVVMPEELLEEVADYARNTRKFKVVGDKIEVEYKGNTYHISQKRLNGETR